MGAQLGFGSVTLELRRTAVLRAIAYQESREPSNISHTGVLAVTTTAAAWQQRAQKFRSSLGDVCIYVFIYGCIYVCMCVCMCASMHV